MSITLCYLACCFCKNIYTIFKKEYLRKINCLGITNFYCSVKCMAQDRKRIALEEIPIRFNSKINKTPGLGPWGDCWEWTGYLDADGYGQFSIGHTVVYRAHRYSYILFKGVIKGKLLVLHGCDNRKCVNPEHLELGTQKKNIQDAVKRKRKKSGVDSPFAKLTAQQVVELRVERAKGAGLKELAKKYSLSLTSCSKICTYKTYK